jgi:hypothetical protein
MFNFILTYHFDDINDCRENFGSFFESFETVSYGTCYRYNSGRNMSGHSTEIISSNTGGINDQFGIKLQKGFGIFVIIHDPLTPPTFESENIYDDVTIVDNANALLSIHKTIKKKTRRSIQCLLQRFKQVSIE